MPDDTIVRILAHRSAPEVYSKPDMDLLMDRILSDHAKINSQKQEIERMRKQLRKVGGDNG